jgi:bifunctional ADP-heptose synthase (sugar kinase/adenylyltransferase)
VVGEGDRAALLSALACVDAVVLFGEDSVAAILERLRPDVHAKGTDYAVETVPERDVSRRLGIETVITGDPKAHASSDVVARLKGRKGR